MRRKKVIHWFAVESFVTIFNLGILGVRSGFKSSYFFVASFMDRDLFESRRLACRVSGANGRSMRDKRSSRKFPLLIHLTFEEFFLGGS